MLNKYYKIIFVFVLLVSGFLFAKSASAAAYYVSVADGNDTNCTGLAQTAYTSGSAQPCPWATVAKVNSLTFSAGDSILFKKGEIWREKLTVPSSGSSGNPITFGAYGTAVTNPIFDGSDLVTGSWIQYTTAGYQTALSKSPGSGWTDGVARNYRDVIPADSSPVNGTKIRITIKASPSGGGGTIASTTIGLMTSGGVFDSAPTPITWNGGSSSVTVAQGQTQVSDEITFAFSKNQRYGVHFYTTDRDFVLTSSGGYGMYAMAIDNSSQADTLSPSGLSLSATLTGFLTLFEVYSEDAQEGVWYQSFVADPILIWDNNSAFVPDSSTANVISNANHSYYTGGNLYIHTSDASNPNTNGRTYEIGARTETFVDNGKSWLILDGIDQRKTAGGAATLGGVKATGSDNIFRNFSTYDHYRHSFCFYSNAQNNLATNIDAYNSHSTTPICIYGPYTTGNTLDNSIIHNEDSALGDSAIRAHGGANGNTVSNSDIYGGTGVDGLIDIYDAGTNLHVTRNKLRGLSNGGGVYLWNGSSSSTIDYNIIDQSQFNTASTYYVAQNYGAIRINNSFGNKIYNNTIVGSDGYPTISQTTNATSTLVKNNIVSGASSFASIDSSSVTNSAYDYNLVYNLSGNFGAWAGTTYATLATWQSGASQDSHSLNSDPKFNNLAGGDYTILSSSPAIDIGTNLGTEYDDSIFPGSVWPSTVTIVDQDLRGVGWEMGAYIYPVPQAPTIGTPSAQSASIIRWNFTDNASDETGFRIYDNTDTLASSSANTNLAYIDETGLSENTQYSGRYATAYNSYGNSASSSDATTIYTLVDTPTNLSASSNSNSITLTVDSFPNDTGGQSGYYFSRSGANSGWIQTNSWTDTGLSCGHEYTYSVIYRNGDGTETSSISTTKSTNGCGGGGGSPAMWTLPTVPAGGFKININGGALTTSNRNVFLGFNAGTDITKVSISMTGDFADASQENYVAFKQWDLCSKLGGAVKNPTCLDGQYKVYAQFYTAYGRTTGNALASSTIVLKSATTSTENLQINNLPFTNSFTKYLQYRQTNTDIKRLQIFLNSDPDTKIAVSGAGSPGKETNFFGLLTKKAVIKFQEKYAKDVLVPWGFVKGTGYVGKTTLAKINELMKNK